MGWRPKTDLDAVMVAVVQNGGEATLGEIKHRIDKDEWARIWKSMGYDRPIYLSIQNLQSRTRRLVEMGKLIPLTALNLSSGARFRVFSKSDEEAIFEELRQGLEVTEQEVNEIQAIATDAEVKIDLAVGEPTRTEDGYEAVISITLTSNRATAERKFAVRHEGLDTFSWLDVIDRVMAEQ